LEQRNTQNIKKRKKNQYEDKITEIEGNIKTPKSSLKKATKLK